MWAEALAAGVSDEVYWQSTPGEVAMLLGALNRNRYEEARAAQLRAGLVAAAVYNVHLKKGARPLQPKDFLPTEPTIVTPQVALSLFRDWASEVNARHRKRVAVS